jgi:ATP-dependent helicase/nuclease subunit B
LWRPRLFAALEWIDAEIGRQSTGGRHVLVSEAAGDMMVRGVRIHGRADRIDRLPGGGLAVVDYKTGTPPSGTMVEKGFSLQLGLIGLIAGEGGFKGVEGEAERFEYWSLGRQKGGDGFGFWTEPVKEERKKSGLPREEFLPATADYLNDAIDRWILGREPFTARLNPDLGGYNDYDQLMRLDEWIITLGNAGEEPAA